MTDHLKVLLEGYYGLSHVRLYRMEGYESINFKVVARQGTFVLKAYRYQEETFENINSENKVLAFIKDHKDSFPVVIKNLQGKELTVPDDGDMSYFFRLSTYLEGTFLAETDKTPQLLSSLGQFLGQLDQCLFLLAPSVFKARKIHWDLDHVLMNESLIHYISSVGDRKLVEYFFIQYKQHVQPHLYELKKSLIHNDANDWNVLIRDGQISGLIDFGDMVYSSTINELAVAITYALMNEEDIVEKASLILSSYHNVHSLEPLEINVLYYLIAMRLCTSVCQSAFHKQSNTESDYITVSEAGAWSLLKKWISINPLYAKRKWLAACGYHEDKAGVQVMPVEKILEKRRNYLSKALSLSYSRPIHMTGAAFQYMYDAEGNTILDAYNNIIQVGHCHPHIVSSAHKAMARLNTNTRYLYDDLIEYSEMLLAKFPSHLNKVFFVNSGSAASDLAIRLATIYTSKTKVAVLQHGYHGNSRLGIDISHYKYHHKGGSGKADFIAEAVLPDTYRGMYRDIGTAGALYADDFVRSIGDDRDIAAFIAEPIVGCGGQVPLASGYLSRVYEEIRKRGGLCISDEVQVGFGRLGHFFWGYEMHGVVPDIVVLGKPIGNGHPMAAVVCSEEVADAFANGMEFFSSFGGNPVSCTVGKAVLEVIAAEELQQHAFEVGQYLKYRLNELKERYHAIGDVRGEGLFLGVDMVVDPLNRTADPLLAKVMKNELRENLILVSTDGPFDNVIKIKPPLCFDMDNADRLVKSMEEILKNYHD